MREKAKKCGMSESRKGYPKRWFLLQSSLNPDYPYAFLINLLHTTRPTLFYVRYRISLILYTPGATDTSR